MFETETWFLDRPKDLIRPKYRKSLKFAQCENEAVRKATKSIYLQSNRIRR